MADINNANVDTLVDIASKTAVSVISAALDENCNEHQLRELLEAEMAVTIKEQIEQKKLLRQLQLAELDILIDVDKVCRKHNLRYYVVGGTLIGAVRHKGFIPWDDDIDISMPRPDFDKLMKIAKDELPEDLFVQTKGTDKGCYFYYAKVRRTGTYFGENKFEHTTLHKGIFIDIFPLDYVPDSPLLQKFFFKVFTCLIGMICSKSKTGEPLYKTSKMPFIWFFRIVQAILPKSFMLWLRVVLGKLANAMSKKNYLASLSGFHGFPQEVAPAEWWGDGVDIEFEGRTFRAPSQYHTLLTHMFGDYMELPPVNKRVCHSVDKEKIIFSGCTMEDYQPKIRRKHSHNYSVSGYIVEELYPEPEAETENK